MRSGRRKDGRQQEQLFLCESVWGEWSLGFTSHAIVGESLTELIDHDEEDTEWIATALHLLRQRQTEMMPHSCLISKTHGWTKGTNPNLSTNPNSNLS